jgi:hypothetical protein
MIAIQFLHDLPEPFVAVVLFVPHILHSATSANVPIVITYWISIDAWTLPALITYLVIPNLAILI